MSDHKQLGKIKSAIFGFGGYQDVQIVFRFEVGGPSWGVVKTIECAWGHVGIEDLLKPDANYKWTHESRIKQLGEGAWEAFELIREAKVQTLDQLVGIPVEVTFDGPCGRLVGMRVLKEVL